MHTSLNDEHVPAVNKGTHFYACICDLNGQFRGKRLAIDLLEKATMDGIRMPLSAAGVDIWGTDVVESGLTFEKGDLDGVCRPIGRGPINILGSDPSSLLLPMWMQKDTGEAFFSDARQVLAHVLRGYEDRGLTPVVSTELEFHLVEPGEARLVPIQLDRSAPSGKFDNIYSIQELDKTSAFFDEIHALAQQSDIAIDSIISEGGPRQFEVTLKHQTDALKAADDTLLIKQIVRAVARRHGAQACFMAKPYADAPGNGMHVHASLLNAKGQNIFDDGTPQGSPELGFAIAGLIASMQEFCLIFAPHANSYRRFSPDSLAPTKASWGYEDRTCAIRVPGGPNVAKRFEHRVSGSDTNPYLVLAAILAGALHGLANRNAPRSHSKDVPGTDLSTNWDESLKVFKASQLAKDLLHPGLVHYFSACKQQELNRFRTELSEFEIETYRSTV
ncbi:glutamine synthetase family protein [Celeribacter naphthalenivorans]|uniref:glutamine synthetase family protein n=1 Tax=Celeribacter naphthalenivorans TaxID=1614694 RepID=UPI001CFB82DC|nr:glutamine synthetase family protein [Celeribacter naphthalenivorans]